MEPSKDAIAVRFTRLNRQILGKVTGAPISNYSKRVVDRETLLDALTVLYDECNDDCVKKGDELIRSFLDKFRSAVAELRRTRVCISDFEMLQLIGRGHFGDVQLVREKHTGDVYALKTLRKESALTRRGIACYEEERDVLAAGAAPWLVKLQYAFQDSTNLYLVMELCSGGDLAGLLSRRNHPLVERDAAFYVAEVTHALRALHALGYVHRDLKPHNILLDRCGHVKLCDFGSCTRLSEGGSAAVAVGTPDYVAPELLAAAACARRHTVCLQYCREMIATGISACDYWSLGVVAFELVTLKRPFSTTDDDSIAHTLNNIHIYERQKNPEPPFPPSPNGPSDDWRSLVAGLLRVQPTKRYHYLDTLQHPSLKHLSPHNIRDQAPPWVPCIRGPEDASHFTPVPREPAPPDALPFRNRAPFAGQLPFIGFSFVAPEQNEEHSIAFNASHDCTAINLATYKSAEKLAALREREAAALQARVAAAEREAERVQAEREAERTRAEREAERAREGLQKEVAQLTVANRRLERELEAEREERRIMERTNGELLTSTKERTSSELKTAYNKSEELETERNILKEEIRRLENRVVELETECERATAAAETARKQQSHYKDTIAKERALRRQTLTGGEVEAREFAAKLLAAEGNATREAQAKLEAEKKLTQAEHLNNTLTADLDDLRKKLNRVQESNAESNSSNNSLMVEVKELRSKLAQDKLECNALNATVQDLKRTIKEHTVREKFLEEQNARTVDRLKQQIQIAEANAMEALQSDTRHRQKVNTLEQLVRQLEREVSALEARGGTAACDERKRDGAMSDTESVSEADTHSDNTAQAQVALLKEQLERTEAQLQARNEQIVLLKQETRTANLSKWRKERELSELTLETKSNSSDVKRLEKRVDTEVEARRAAQRKATTLQADLDVMRPELETLRKELAEAKEELATVEKIRETLQAEVDRSRNDIRKLKSELMYSEKRRIHAETQEECASRERAQLRDEAADLRAQGNQLTQNNKALQEACSLLEEQLTDLEKLADLHEIKNNDLESETRRMREELSSCRGRLAEAERAAGEGRAAAAIASRQHEDAQDALNQAHSQIMLLRERLECREIRAAELELQLSACESGRCAAEGQAVALGRRVRDLQEECANLRTRSHHAHGVVLQLQQELLHAQEEISAAREAADTAAAWWRTRETKADATLRQQAKLIDFLQAKVEEANRKKCSLGNKLFGGNKGRRPVASPPLRKANRELRDEVEKLRARLAAADANYEPTPKKERTSRPINGTLSIDTPDGGRDSAIQLVWSDGRRERVNVRIEEGVVVCTPAVGGEVRGALLHIVPPHADCDTQKRAFTISPLNNLDNDKSSPVTVICSNPEEKSRLLCQLTASRPLGYVPPKVATFRTSPTTAICLAEDAIAIGCADGLHSLHGPVRLEWESSPSPCEAGVGAVTAAAVGSGRALLVRDGMLLHTGLHTLTSTLKRAAALEPLCKVQKVNIPDTGAVTMVQALSGDATECACAVAACGRRVFLLRRDDSDLKVSRSFTVDRRPNSLLLTTKHLYIAGEKLLRVALPSGALEPFGTDEPVVVAAARKRSQPKAILLIRNDPVEILLCYDEFGVFVDENGKRTRNEDAKWTTKIYSWQFVEPFLYAVGKDVVVVSYINEHAYVPPPCTCDDHSVASTASDCATPRRLVLQVKEPVLLGTTSKGVLIRTTVGDEYAVLAVDGMIALRSIGASVESLESVSGRRTSDGSRTSRDDKDEDADTGFLADIRKRATQLRRRSRGTDPDDVIKGILSAEVGPRRSGLGRRSPATVSEFSSDTDSLPSTSDLCADMFTRQVRFQ